VTDSSLAFCAAPYEERGSETPSSTVATSRIHTSSSRRSTRDNLSIARLSSCNVFIGEFL
jgi:hypothetical protein